MVQRNGFFDEEQRQKHSRYFSADFKKKKVIEWENNRATVWICKAFTFYGQQNQKRPSVLVRLKDLLLVKTP